MQYFPLKNKHVSEEKHLKLIANGTPILIGLEPHGVLPLQMAAIADYYLFDGAIRTARDHECFKNEEERQRLRDAFAVSSAFASSSIFYVPLVRHLWPWLGLDPISRYHVKKVLSNGGVAIIVPGGVSEVLKMEKEREVVYLRKRYGFVKIAIQSGAALMPAYAFGATRTYSWWRLGPPLMTKKLAERISKILLFAPIVFWGRFFGPCPRRGRVVTVYGPPIEVKQTDEPTQEYVREVLDKFIEELEKVYRENRDEFGYKGVELVVE
jgi:2-acylglycerol O-acyltransferase 2